MSSSTFLQGLMAFDKDTINAEMVELLDAYLSMPDYTLEGAKKVRILCMYKICSSSLFRGVKFHFPVRKLDVTGYKYKQV